MHALAQEAAEKAARLTEEAARLTEQARVLAEERARFELEASTGTIIVARPPPMELVAADALLNIS